MVGRWRRDPKEGSSGAQVDELLELSSLQRLAREKVAELEVRLPCLRARELCHARLCSASGLGSCHLHKPQTICIAPTRVHAGAQAEGCKLGLPTEAIVGMVVSA